MIIAEKILRNIYQKRQSVSEPFAYSFDKTAHKRDILSNHPM